ncbi:MAG: hypothetical protein L6264_07235 [Weeksellaceae bacterium]|nr:hypothetical protein [Bacteroidota bacterium]MCG2780726.1 hypothetical protein [Weeksellaceae bacterium]
MKKITGFALLIIATGLIIPLTVVNRHYVDEKYGDTDGYFRDTAYNIDVWANREFRATWNALLRTEGGYAFGREGETISSALGKNERDGTLTEKGKQLVKLLNALDKDHCRKAIVEY